MKRSRIRSISVKRRAANAERKTALETVVARAGNRCEARTMIATVDVAQSVKCDLFGVEGHEKLKRSRGGSITDPANIVWICRNCHDWTEAEPKLATECGLLIPSWATRP